MPPVETVDEAVAELERVEAELPPSDGVKWFAYLYSATTTAIGELFDAGRFESPAFMAALVVRFANVFFDTLERPSHASAAWRAFLDRRGDRDVAPIQFAIGGLNCHLGYDSPVGLAAEWRAAGVHPSSATPERRDYDLVNATIAAVEPGAKTYLLTGAVKEVDRLFGGADDVVAGWSVEVARAAAWAHGTAIYRLEPNPVLLDAYLAGLAPAVAAVTELLLVPTAV